MSLRVKLPWGENLRTTGRQNPSLFSKENYYLELNLLPWKWADFIISSAVSILELKADHSALPFLNTGQKTPDPCPSHVLPQWADF